MKKFVLALIAMVTMTVSANAMGYEQARQQALFLTDKMAYELNLTDEQYDAAYEINLDYLMSVRTVDDLYSSYWERRNLDLSYILLSWQYRAFCDAAYFYRPLYWDAGYWHFGIYARYPHRDYFFFGRPAVYVEYRGGHSWHMNGGRSWYRDRHICPPRNNHFGMRDGFRRGDYGNGFQGNPSSRTQFGTAKRQPMMNNGGGTSFGNRGNNGSFGNANRGNVTSNGSFGTGRRPSAQRNNGTTFGNGGRESSTRSTVGGGSFGSARGGATTSTPRNTFSPRGNEGSSTSSPSFGSGRRPSSSFGSGRGGSSFGGSSSSGTSAPAKSNGSFGGGRSSGGSSFGSGRSSGGGSFGGGRSSGGGSFGGGRSSGGGSFGSGRSSGGGSFGGSHGGGSFGSRR